MKKLKSILKILIGIFTFYLVVSFIWGILNMQTCSYNLPKNPTCEQTAENNSKNCKYVIFRWKTVDYHKELKKCREWK